MPRGKAKGLDNEDEKKGGGKVLLVRKEGDTATVTVYPVGENVNGTTYVTKTEHAVKDLALIISRDDHEDYADLVLERLEPIIRKKLADAVPGEPVSVSLDRSSYDLRKRGKGKGNPVQPEYTQDQAAE